MVRISNFALAFVVALAASNSAVAFSPSHPAFARHAVQLWVAAEGSSTLSRLPDSAVEISLKIPGKATQAAYDKACFELSKTLVVPGFRKGARIPPQVLEQCMSSKEGGRYALRVEAINSLLGQLIGPALKDEHGLEPIGQPSLVVPVEDLAATFSPGEDVELLVKCDVWPEIQWAEDNGGKPYYGLTGSYSRKPFNQEKMDKAMNDLRERYATLQPAAEGSILAIGDACRVNMVGYMAKDDGSKGDPLPNAASGDNVEIVLGTGRYMVGLVEGLVGAKVGESRVVTVEFPMILRDKSLAGRKAIFDVDILEASHRSLPDVTDEFANMVRPGLTAETLALELRKAVDSEDSKEYVGARNAALSAALAKVMDVEVPDTLVTNQAREKFAMMMTEMRDNGLPDEEIKKQIKPENFLKYKKIVKDDIVRDFKVSMATDEIARIEGLEVPDYQIEEQIEAIKKDAKGEEIDEAMIRGKVETTILRSIVFDFLAEHAKLEVKYATESFDEELMEKLAEESLERELKLAAETGGASD